MTSHAPPESIAARLAQLPRLSMTELWSLWDEHFDQRPGHHHRNWLESRLAYRIQERAFGGLRPRVRRRLEEIGEAGVIPDHLPRVADRLLPGTVLSRTFGAVEHRVMVRGQRDFEYNGQRFKSLSAIARVITGTQWSGPAFFGLRETRKEKP